MDDKDDNRPDLTDAVIRVCPACCTVNPGGPSTTCPHVQLARFAGVTPALGALLAEVASARRAYTDLNSKLKAAVLDAIRDGTALVETPRSPRAGADDAEVGSGGRRRDLSLAPSEPAALQRERPLAAPRRRRAGMPAVDPRQLTLLALSPPKGDA